MNLRKAVFEKVRPGIFAAAFFIAACFAPMSQFWAQTSDVYGPKSDVNADQPGGPGSDPSDVSAGFRIEKVRVAGGAEILTIFADAGGMVKTGDKEIPMVSVLRDTLGDYEPDNDQLRYVWMLTYTKPSLGQKIAAFVPFLYTRTTNNNDPGKGPPPAIADIRRSNKAVWNMVIWTVFKKLILGPAGAGPRSSVLQYHQNKTDYRRSAIARALSILALYQSVNGEKLLSDSELKDIQSRLWLTDKTFGWHVQDENLSRVYDKEMSGKRDIRGHNWELLRQYSEEQGLYFEPLVTEDGAARHAIVWVAAEDLASNRDRKYNSRFLNIKNPWKDSKLTNWKGYSQVRWFDNENRVVEPDTAGASPKTMIPLAIYGLDNPRFPAILVDFRDNSNPKKREMSKRVLNDITGNVLSVSKFSSLPYFLGRFIYDFATGRRAMDLNQPSRLRSYAQLKTLLMLDESLDADFRDEIAKRLEHVSLNPLENDLDVEAELARKQYKNLIDYAKRPDGLPAKLDKQRREEMVKLAHNGKERTWFRIAHIFSLGLYTHREDSTPELMASLNIRRQLDHHERYLREVAYASVKPEVDTDVVALRRSLLFISQNGSGAKEKTARALGKIFASTDDDDMRSLCVTGLYRINNSSAKNQLLAIFDDPKNAERWRSMSASYLKKALSEGQEISVRDAETIAGIGTD